MAETSGLLNRRRGITPTEGSNPSVSAMNPAAMSPGHGRDMRGMSHRFIASPFGLRGFAPIHTAKQDALRSFSEGGAAALFYVYLIQSVSHPDQRYIGCTDDLPARLERYNAGASKHTSKYQPHPCWARPRSLVAESLGGALLGPPANSVLYKRRLAEVSARGGRVARARSCRRAIGGKPALVENGIQVCAAAY